LPIFKSAIRDRIVLKPSVEKDLHDLPKATVVQIMQRVGALTADPFPPGSLKLSSSERLYRIRVGDYRVVYEVVTKAEVVMVHHVRHRRDVYRHIR
jgi:mRNA interferase RelE/StbE